MANNRVRDAARSRGGDRRSPVRSCATVDRRVNANASEYVASESANGFELVWIHTAACLFENDTFQSLLRLPIPYRDLSRLQRAHR